MALSIHAQWKIEIVSYVVNGTVFFVINIVFKSNKSLLSVLFFSLIVVAFTGKGVLLKVKLGTVVATEIPLIALNLLFFIDI